MCFLSEPEWPVSGWGSRRGGAKVVPLGESLVTECIAFGTTAFSLSKSSPSSLVCFHLGSTALKSRDFRVKSSKLPLKYAFLPCAHLDFESAGTAQNIKLKGSS